MRSFNHKFPTSNDFTVHQLDEFFKRAPTEQRFGTSPVHTPQMFPNWKSITSTEASTATPEGTYSNQNNPAPLAYGVG